MIFGILTMVTRAMKVPMNVSTATIPIINANISPIVILSPV